jgi:glycosyltransferase involved in cell wall biosynthesis
MGLTALIAARRGGLPLFGSYHTAYEENIRRRAEMRLRHLGLLTAAAGRFFNRLTWRYVIWFFNHMEKVVAPSRFTRSRISRLITPPTGIFSRGVDTETFNPRFRRTRPQVTALFVGRLVVDKNLEALVDIFANRDDVQLVVVGDGSERSWLEAALPDAEFTGHLTGEELSEAYASADLFVFPSETETFGNVVLEATASGLPVVTSDRMAPRELIDHGVNGYVARVGVDFGERVDTLIRDPGLRLTMGSAARRYALTRSWEAVFNGLIEDYRSLFSSARAAFEPAPASRSRAPLVRPCGEGPETALP